MIKGPKRSLKRPKLEVGWREFVALPDLGIPSLRAKVDTGARTSALHAVALEVYEKDGAPWVSFQVPLPGKPRRKRCAAPLLDERWIKNTGGEAEQRYIVRTTLVLGKRHWHIEVSLANREKMEFDLILGRTAIRRHRLLVDPGKSYLNGPPAALKKAGQTKVSQRQSGQAGVQAEPARRKRKERNAP